MIAKGLTSWITTIYDGEKLRGKENRIMKFLIAFLEVCVWFRSGSSIPADKTKCIPKRHLPSNYRNRKPLRLTGPAQFTIDGIGWLDTCLFI